MGPKKENVPLLKGKEAEDLVASYLKEQYRPYSVSDLVLNLHNQINKPTMTKCLESLVSQSEIVSKTYGKMVYYVYKEEIGEDLTLEISAEAIDDLKEKLNDLNQIVKLLQIDYNNLIELPTNEEAVERIPGLEKEVANLEAQLESIKGEGNSRLSKHEIDKHKNYTKELERIFRQRRKMFNNFLNMIKEGVENYSSVIAEIGIDLDQVKDLSRCMLILSLLFSIICVRTKKHILIAIRSSFLSYAYLSTINMGYLEYIRDSGISKEKIDNLILNYFIVEGYQEAAISFAKEINSELKNERIKSHSPSLNPFIKQLGSMSSMNNESFSETARGYFEKYVDSDSTTTPHSHHHATAKPKIISDYSTINQRKEIKLLILKGSITDAIHKISEYFPTILDSNNLLHFKLLQLNLIEMIRNHKLNNGNSPEVELERKFLDDILTFVRENLISKVTHSSKLLKELEITMSLLCFNFDEGKSIEEQKDLPEELRSLFNLSLRNQCYRLVNKAILNLYYNEETIEENGNVNGNVNRNNQGLYNGEIENNKEYKGPKYLEFDLLGFDKFESEEKDIAMMDDETNEATYDYNLKYDENIAHINAEDLSNDFNITHDDNLQDELQDLSLESKLERIIKLWTIAEQRLVDLNFHKSKQYDFTEGNL